MIVMFSFAIRNCCSYVFARAFAADIIPKPTERTVVKPREVGGTICEAGRSKAISTHCLCMNSYMNEFSLSRC